MFAILVKEQVRRTKRTFGGAGMSEHFCITRWLLFGVIPIYVEKRQI